MLAVRRKTPGVLCTRINSIRTSHRMHWKRDDASHPVIRSHPNTGPFVLPGRLSFLRHAQSIMPTLNPTLDLG